MYNNVGGERMALYADNSGSTLYGDLSKQSLLDFNYAVMGLRNAATTKFHARASRPITSSAKQNDRWRGLPHKNVIWPGVDIDIPTEPSNSRCQLRKASRKRFSRPFALARQA